MSASASKKRRKDLQQEGLSPRQVAAAKAKKEKKQHLKTVLLIVMAVVVSAGIIAGLIVFLNSRKYQPDYDVNTPVATVGDYEISVPMFNYYYIDAVSSYINMYGSYLSYLSTLDVSTSLDSQYQDEDNGVTWGDYFEDQAKETIQAYYNIYDDAVKNGFELSDEDSDAVDAAVDAVKESAKAAGVASADRYLAKIYGIGCDLDSYREYCRIRQVVSSYYKQCDDAITFTADEVTAKYEEDPNAFDAINYSLYTVAAQDYVTEDETQETSAEDDTTETTEAEITEEAIAAAEAAAKAAAEDFPLKDAQLKSDGFDAVKSTISEDAQSWMFDTARKEGDVSYFYNETAKTYYVVRYENRDTHDYKPANAYIINIPFDTDTEDDAETEEAEATQTAEEKFNAVCDALTDAMTDEEFSQLGTTYGTSYSGITNDIIHGAYDDEINDWLFDSARKAGDTQSFTTDTGYFVVRFSSLNDNTYCYKMVEDTMHSEASDEWYHEVTEKLTATMDDNMKGYINSDITPNVLFNLSSTAE